MALNAVGTELPQVVLKDLYRAGDKQCDFGNWLLNGLSIVELSVLFPATACRGLLLASAYRF